MSKMLYIKASPIGGLSFSIAAADAFIEEYRRTHPGDTVKTIDLFNEQLSAFDFASASAKYKTMHCTEHSENYKKISNGGFQRRALS